MMIIKNNQALEIKIAYDDGAFFFDEFINDEGFTRLSDYQWLVIKNPDEKRFTADDLKNAESVQDRMNELDLSVIDKMDLSDKEAENLYHSLNWGLVHDIDIARKGLLSLPFVEWLTSLDCHSSGEDWKEAMAEYRNIARGACGEYAEIYIQGSDEEETNFLVKQFSRVAYSSPYYFTIDLIDGKSGNIIDDDGLGGIYDDSMDLKDLKVFIHESINNLLELDEGLKQEAFEEIEKLDYLSINA